MSGKEEEPYRDIPVCSMCGIRPEFWILQPEKGINGWFWLHSNKAIEKDGWGKLVFVPDGGDVFTLDEVVSVTCRPKAFMGTQGRGPHIFIVGNVMFDKVLQQARRYEVEWER